jgi:hypothetical protein
MPPPFPLSSPSSNNEAFRQAMNNLLPECPLLMHGSGDVFPAQVNPDTAALVAELTTDYIGKLVDAAVEAHDLLLDGAGGILPPPALANHRKPSAARSQKKHRKNDNKQESWDEPLPLPKIRQSPQTSTTPTTTTPGTLNQRGETNRLMETDEKESEAVDPSEWVGAAGVDLYEQRPRRSHVGTTSAIGTQCFIFPICHDAQLYSRVMELQSARRSIAPVLLDAAWMDTINDEGERLRNAKRKRSASIAKEKKGAEDDDDEEEEDQDEAEGDDAESGMVPTWPGMDDLLPIHRTDG